MTAERWKIITLPGSWWTTPTSRFYESIFHPKRAHSDRPQKHFEQVPGKLKNLYREIISAYNEDLNLLCAAGLRALIEGICENKKISGPSLEARIDGMTSLLPASIVKNLHAFRFIGNVAVHQLEAPDKDDLGLALDVIEDILNFLYALDYKASMLERLRAAKEDRRKSPPAVG